MESLIQFISFTFIIANNFEVGNLNFYAAPDNCNLLKFVQCKCKLSSKMLLAPKCVLACQKQIKMCNSLIVETDMEKIVIL